MHVEVSTVCGCGPHPCPHQRLMEVVHLKRGLSPKGAFEAFVSIHLKTETKMDPGEATVGLCSWDRVEVTWQPRYNERQPLPTQLPFSHTQGTLWEQRGLSRLEGPSQLCTPSSSRHEHEPCLQAEEDLGQSENSQVLHPRGKHGFYPKGCGQPVPEYCCSHAPPPSPPSTRWTPRGISATIGQPCVGQLTAR